MVSLGHTLLTMLLTATTALTNAPTNAPTSAMYFRDNLVYYSAQLCIHTHTHITICTRGTEFMNSKRKERRWYSLVHRDTYTHTHIQTGERAPAQTGALFSNWFVVAYMSLGGGPVGFLLKYIEEPETRHPFISLVVSKTPGKPGMKL